MGTIKDFKFKLIENFFTPEEVPLGLRYLLLKHKRNFSHFDKKQSSAGDSYFYGDELTDVLLMTKRKKVMQESGLELLPTYAFSRIYTYGADLKPHKDRPSCEISVTAMWGSDGTSWPIYMDGHEVNMKPGDAVLYSGCELEHYRKKFEGDFHVQTFFHYVDKNGVNKEWLYDKRHPYDDPEI